MPTDLARHIRTTRLCDTHEHLKKEPDYLRDNPDVLQNLFGNYVSADLIVAGGGREQVADLTDPTKGDVATRFEGVRETWEAVRHTGYGEAVRIIARELYGIDDITPRALISAAQRSAEICAPGQRLHILRDFANLDHVQTDDFCRPCYPDETGRDFFFYDISWARMAAGSPDLDVLARETGIEVRSLADLRRAQEEVFRRHGSVAIAVKSQHAYERTLRWQERDDADAGRALIAFLRSPETQTEADRLCLGDWCLARGVELAIESDLPFKLHTGYYAGHGRMPVDYIRGGNLCALLAKYADARFVLMHIAYPYNDELVALAKHYPNVYVDLCWAWSIDPTSASSFVRTFIHTVPANKLFAFGGDTGWPAASLAYSRQARTWLDRALTGEVDDGLLTEREAMDLATRFMRDNQYACFRVSQKKAALAASGETASRAVATSAG